MSDRVAHPASRTPQLALTLVLGLCLGFSAPARPQGAAGQAVQSESCTAEQQGEEGCKKDEEKEKDEDKPKVKKLSEFIKGKDRLQGLFDFYQDPKTGQLYMQITREQLGKDFIYFSYVRNGAARPGMPGFGQIRHNAVMTIRRSFQRVDFIQRNTAYSFDEDSPVGRRKDANIPSPLLSASKVVAESRDGSVFLIEADEVFTTNRFVTIGDNKQARLSKEKSAILSIRNYPDNTEIIAEYVFDFANASSPAASSLTVEVQHNFIRMPEEGFTPRREDPRVGFFTERRTNLTRKTGLPYDDVIQRWRLIKKDPAAEVSEPVKPIVFWIENTTPLEYRDIIREAVLAWNPVFEKAGFRNAIRVEIQPDDAAWDAGDIRYNVIRWVATPVPQYLGYSPRFTNPWTGEILGADIVLEHASVRSWLWLDTLYGGSGSQGTSTVGLLPEGLIDASGYHTDPAGSHPEEACMAGWGMQMGVSFAQLAQAATPERSEEIVRQGLRYLVLHEVGHALGLTHNMMASYYQPLAALNAKVPPEEQPLANSVMDYPAVNVSADPQQQGLYFPTAPGPYDYWAIAFGYDDRMENADFRDALLARSSSPELRFGNDGDSMAHPENGIDPRVNTFDLSSEPIAFALHQVSIANAVMADLIPRVAQPGESWEEVRRAFETLLNVRAQAAKTVSRYIAGVYVDRAFVGQPTDAPAPFTPVEYEVKKQAMRALGELLFAPDAFQFPDGLIAHLQEQRRGFDFYGFKRQDPLVHAWVRSMQEDVLRHLLSHRVLRRLSDSALYGNRYSVHEMLADLNREIFAADAGKDVNTFRRNLQVAYVKQLIATYGSGTLDGVSEAALFWALNEIDELMRRSQPGTGIETLSHRRYIRHLIERGLEDQGVPMPGGALTAQGS